MVLHTLDFSFYLKLNLKRVGDTESQLNYCDTVTYTYIIKLLDDLDCLTLSRSLN